MTLGFVLFTIFLAVFTQSLTGFGSALVAMALLPGVVGIQVATPLVALVAGTLEIFLVARYYTAFNWRAIWRIALASLVGIPLGLLLLKRVDERIILAILGVVISGYALYALLDLKLPELLHPMWAFGLGFVSGLLGGAYNTSGPPVIIYGTCRRWMPAEFKSNLQGYFLLNSILIIGGHIWSHNFTPLVLREFIWSLPVIILGVVLGVSLDRYLDAGIFRKIVLWLLVFMGLRLIF